MYMAPPRDPTPDEASQLIRYQGGYWGDPGRASYVYNFLPLRPSEYHPGSPVAIRRLPKDYQAMTTAMGHWDPNPDASVDDGSQWWILEDESVSAAGPSIIFPGKTDFRRIVWEREK